MRLYLDTSVLVSCLTHEPETPQSQVWLEARAKDTLFISDWVITEFAVALSVKLRGQHIDEGARTAATQQFRLMSGGGFEVIRVGANHFRHAAQLAAQHRAGLKAGDALHLGICAEHGVTLCTRDRGLAQAGRALSMPCWNVPELLPVAAS